MKLLCVFAFLAAAIQLGYASNILVTVAMPSRSHSLLFDRLCQELAKKGHTITYISANPLSKPTKNVKEIILPNYQEALRAKIGKEGFTQFDMRNLNIFLILHIMSSMGPTLMENILSDSRVQELINSNEKFDAVLGEIFLDESLIGGFAHKFKAPLITVATFMPNDWPNYAIGNPAPSSYIPSSFMAYGSKMTFLERLNNFIITSYEQVLHRVFDMNAQNRLFKKFFGEDTPCLREIIRNTSLVLVNYHHSLSFPRPMLPNMVEIGGYHINPPKPLPADLKQFMDNAKDGVVYFSMGSHMKSADLPPKAKDEILKAFSRLKQDVLWKFEDDSLSNLPKNVRILKWAPQSDLLAHPNLKLFITHGGLLSTMEAVFRGVPVLGIPVFGDQPLNMLQTERAGFGKKLDLDELTEETFYNAIMEVLNNPKYTEIVKAKSKVIQDSPLTPMETAIFWIEYVIRHKGAPHLRSPAQDLNIIQLYQLDVVAVLLVGAVVSLKIGCCALKFACRKVFGRKCCSKKTDKATSSKKTN